MLKRTFSLNLMNYLPIVSEKIDVTCYHAIISYLLHTSLFLLTCIFYGCCLKRNVCHLQEDWTLFLQWELQHNKPFLYSQFVICSFDYLKDFNWFLTVKSTMLDTNTEEIDWNVCSYYEKLSRTRCGIRARDTSTLHIIGSIRLDSPQGQ